MYDRQIRLFGEAGQKILQELTVGIVGLGGIGSCVFVWLVRLGIGRIIAIDHDTVELSNLNRLAGSTLVDAEERTPKVKMLKDYAGQINPHTQITAIQESICEENATDRLKPCDAFFGCTDNESSRWRLNKFSTEHLIAYFDTGTGIQANAEQNIEHAGGQVRIVIPGMGCLNCINGIAIDIAQQEMLPEPDRQVAIDRSYIDGADVHAPSVGPLNGVIASLAVTEFMAFTTGFKPLQRYVFYDLLKARVVGLNFDRDPNCFTCSSAGSFGIGDHGMTLPVDMLPKLNEIHS
ncbi:ThiF family adenylyltransferase [Planctomycetota bacterium]